MKKEFLIGPLWVLVFLGPFLCRVQAAQPEKQPLPAGPLVAAPVNLSQWEIDFTYADDKDSVVGTGPAPEPTDASSNVSLPRKVTIVRTQPLWHAMVVDRAGRSSECWYEGTEHFMKGVGAQGYSMAAVDPDTMSVVPFLLGYDKTDFPGLDWVSPETYVGVEKSGETSLLVFQQGGSDGASVWINMDTRYPVQWKKSGETRTFVQLPPPSDKLVLPGELTEVAEAIHRMKEIGRRQSGQP